MNIFSILPRAIILIAFLAIAAAAERPNIVLLMSNDQGWGDVGYRGHPYIKTPNLDAMAEEGLRFDRFYAGGPNSVHSRIVALTGQAAARWGSNRLFGLVLPEKITTLPEMLQNEGYVTGHFGKWELGSVDPGAAEPA